MKKTLPAVFLSMTLGISACAGEEREETVVLTEQQKEILAEEGLPVEKAALNDAQLDAIESIQELLDWLAESYDDHFVYQGYLHGSSTEPETLFVESEKLSCRITVTRRYDGTRELIESDYEEKAAGEPYEKLQTAYWQSQGFEQAHVFANVLSVSDGEGSLLQRARCHVYVLLSAGQMAGKTLDDLLEDYLDWYREQGGRSQHLIRIGLLAEEDPGDIYMTEETVADVFASDRILETAGRSLQTDGSRGDPDRKGAGAC